MNMIKQLFYIGHFLLFFLLNTSTYAKEPPNIILLFVDDWGWMDVGYRNNKYVTPNINQLKEESMEFTRTYVSTPTCSPSRASILTGKEAVRMQMVRHIVHSNPDGSNDDKFSFWKKDPVQRPSINYLPLEEVTYAEALKEYGYYNAFFGKWHLGHTPYHPIHQGFDEQNGTTNWGHPKSYYPPYFKSGFGEMKEGEFLTDNLTNQTTSFIKDYDKEQPFMISLWYYGVHGPHVGKKEHLDLYKGLPKREQQYGAMVTAVDESVGQIREALKLKGLDENTIIILTSDQGGFFSQAPLSGGKIGGNTLGEGGARVPMLIHTPDPSNHKKEIDTPVSTIDIFPTLMEIASQKKYKNTGIQGVSLWSTINGKKKIKDRNLYFMRSYEDQYASVIQNDWKLVKYHSGKKTLFNIALDQSEKNDLYTVETKVAKELEDALLDWENEVYSTWEKVDPPIN